MPGEGTLHANRISAHLLKTAAFCPLCSAALVESNLEGIKKCPDGHGILYQSGEYFDELVFKAYSPAYKDVP